MSITPTIMAFAAIAGVVINLFAVLVAAIGIIRANRESINATEHRITTRITALEVGSATLAAKVQRAENDIQAIFRDMPKRSHASEQT